jgi:hypothetical protein
MHLLGHGSTLLYVVECPSPTKITQLTEDKQFDQGTLLIFYLVSTPPIKEQIDPHPLNQILVIIVRKLKLQPKLCPQPLILKKVMI